MKPTKNKSVKAQSETKSPVTVSPRTRELYTGMPPSLHTSLAGKVVSKVWPETLNDVDTNIQEEYKVSQAQYAPSPALIVTR